MSVRLEAEIAASTENQQVFQIRGGNYRVQQILKGYWRKGVITQESNGRDSIVSYLQPHERLTVIFTFPGLWLQAVSDRPHNRRRRFFHVVFENQEQSLHLEKRLKTGRRSRRVLLRRRRPRVKARIWQREKESRDQWQRQQPGKHNRVKQIDIDIDIQRINWTHNARRASVGRTNHSETPEKNGSQEYLRRWRVETAWAKSASGQRQTGMSELARG
ncbi:hypothetical protein C8R43DRAFT_1210668 [Mycena crocata]|nr:hypothetical protein C8R43DRAFT_1210668 [Mycena crocata]